jgi:hypothetical protein
VPGACRAAGAAAPHAVSASTTTTSAAFLMFAITLGALAGYERVS